jgi:hypothetical protein
MRDHRLGRDAAFDQPRRRGRLHHSARAGAASKFRTPRHDHPELRRDHVEPLGGVLADHRHRRPAAWAGSILGRERHFDPRQVRRQSTTAGAPLGRIVLAQLGVLLLRLRLIFGDRLLERLQAQLQLFLRQALGAGTEMHPRQLQQQMAQPVILRQ